MESVGTVLAVAVVVVAVAVTELQGKIYCDVLCVWIIRGDGGQYL